MESITQFDGKYRFLSNFWPAQVKYEKYLYPSVEHAYQAAKSFHDPSRIHLTDALIPASKAKKFGQSLDIRPDWEFAKLTIMEGLVRQKFLNLDLMRWLLATKDAYLEEGNYWHDQYWGNCTCARHKDFPGKNHLGRILMNIRVELQGYSMLWMQGIIT